MKTIPPNEIMSSNEINNFVSNLLDEVNYNIFKIYFQLQFITSVIGCKHKHTA